MRQIVCAAIRFNGDVIVCGARHYDMIMHKVIANLYASKTHLDARSEEQGFIDNHGLFLNRADAFVVATEAGQIKHKTGNVNSPTLFSEDLY